VLRPVICHEIFLKGDYTPIRWLRRPSAGLRVCFLSGRPEYLPYHRARFARLIDFPGITEQTHWQHQSSIIGAGNHPVAGPHTDPGLQEFKVRNQNDSLIDRTLCPLAEFLDLTIGRVKRSFFHPWKSLEDEDDSIKC
jgi:hypothetical protein